MGKTDETMAKEFNTAVDKFLNKKCMTATQMKLQKFSQGIMRMRENDVPYTVIIQTIAKVTKAAGEEWIVSQQSLRTYCQTFLGSPKKPMNKKRVIG